MAEPKKRIYAATTLAVPPLKMVLVHARSKDQKPANRPPAKARVEELLEKERLIRRIIAALEELD